MKSKILIIGPIENIGGRELEAGFIASVLKEYYDVKVLSTGNQTDVSQFYEVVDDIKMTSLKKLLYQKYLLLKPATVFSYLKNKKKKPLYFYVNNSLNSRFIKIREDKILKIAVSKCDMVLLVAHLQTLRTKEIIKYSQELKKPVIFRTTGEIPKITFPLYLQKVSYFIHHSEKNALNLHKDIREPGYKIIDQTSYFERQLLDIPLNRKRPHNFGVIGRLSPEKNIEKLIANFKQNSSMDDTLFLVGEGELYLKLQRISEGIPNIRFMGSLPSTDIPDFIRGIDCLILSSYTEAGPLVGVEAMAAGKLILSTRVGAMPERLKSTYNDFWFDPDDSNSFKRQFRRIKDLKPLSVYTIGRMNREAYLKKYSQEVISNEYLNLVDDVLNYS